MKSKLQTNLLDQLEKYPVTTQRLLFFFVSKMTDEHKRVLIVPVKEIKSYISIPVSNKDFKNKLLNQLRDISSFHLEYSGSLVMNKEYVSGISLASFFSTIAYVPDSKNPKVKLVLNNASHARISLVKELLAQQFRQTDFIKSKYARRMEQVMLKSDKPEKTYTLDELFAVLSIPASYRSKISNLSVTILAPMQNELKQLYHDFKIIPIRAPYRGRRVTGYKISWKKDKQLNTQLELPINEIEDNSSFTNKESKYRYKSYRKNDRKIIQKETIPDWDAEAKKHQKSATEHKKIRKEIKKNLADLKSIISD